MTGNYKCRIWVNDDGWAVDDGDGSLCAKGFNDDKARCTHEKLHTPRRCRWCEGLFSNNGHTQHQSACTERPAALPWEVWADVLADFLAHAQEIPDGSVCLLSTRKGAVLMTASAAFDTAAQIAEDEPVVIIPAALLPKPDKAARWRRRDMDTPRDLIEPTPIEEQPMRSKPPARPEERALGGINWDAMQ